MTNDRRPRHAVAVSGLGRAAGSLARRPRLGLAVALVLAALAALGWRGGVPRDRFAVGPAWDEAEEVDRRFALDEVAALVAVTGPVLDARHEARLRDLERALEAPPWNAALVTPWDLPGLADSSLAAAAEHPLVRDLLVARGGRGLLLPLRWSPERSDEGAREDADESIFDALGRRARSALAQSSGEGALAPLEVGVTGTWPIIAAQRHAFGRERWRFQVLGAVLGFVIASLAFRDLRATFLAGLPPLLGVGLSLGLTRLAGFGASGFTSIVLPLLVLTIGFTDSLHIVVEAARARRADPISGGEAAARALAQLVWPCALTSLTTAIGFASLAATGSAIVREFGLSCAIATLVTFVCVVVSIPLLARTPLGAALHQVRPPRFDTTDAEHHAALATSWIDRALRATLRRPRATAALAVTATIALACAASTLRIDRRVATDLAASSEAARTLARVDRDLGGAFPLYVRIEWDARVPGAEVLALCRTARRALDAEPLITASLGLDRLAEAALTGAAAGPARDALAWGLLSRLPGTWVSPVLDASARVAVLHARVPDAGARALAPAFARVRAALAAAERPGVRVRLVSAHVAYLETVTAVGRDLAQSLALAAVLILATLGVAFRSWRLGLAAVVPNLLPLAASAAGLALIGHGVDISALTSLTLSLGIGTDDTIHVLARWQTARARGLEAHAAARDAVLRTLPALALTTATLTAAFAQLLTSDLPTIQVFGLLAATTLVTAFVADVWLLPAFLVVSTRARSRRGYREAPPG